MGMFSDWLKKDDPQGLEAVRLRLLEGLSELPDGKKKAVKDIIDKRLGLGQTAAGRQRKQNLSSPGEELATAVDKAAGASQSATYDPKKDATSTLPTQKPVTQRVRQSLGREKSQSTPEPGDELKDKLMELGSNEGIGIDDLIRVTANHDANTPSGLERREGAFRPYNSPGLAALNELTGQFDERNNSSYFDDESERLFSDETSPYYFDTTFGGNDDAPFNPSDNEYNSESLADRALSGSMGAGAYDKSNLKRQAGSSVPSFDEIQNFREKFADPESRTPEGIQRMIRPSRGRYSPEQVTEFVDQLPNGVRSALFKSGMGGPQGKQAVAKYKKIMAELYPDMSEDDIVRKRVDGMAKGYLEQDMRDSYLSNENSKTRDIRDLVFDHIFPESDTEHWQGQIDQMGSDGLAERYGREMDTEDSSLMKKVMFDLANDPDTNAALTRKGFNGQQKKKKSIDELYNDKNFTKKYFGDNVTEESMTEKLTGDAKKSVRKKLRLETFYKPLQKELSRLIDSGEMTPEVYNEIFDRYKEAREGLEGPITKRKAYFNDRNIDTDIWRMFADKDVMGYNLFAEEGMREKEDGHGAGWSGFAGTTSGSNAGEDSGEYPTYPFVPSATDHYRDAMYRHKLFGMDGDRERSTSVTNGIHLLTKLMGSMFTGGQRVGSGDWSDYLGTISEFLHDKLPEEAKGEFDRERAGNYRKVVNVALNKLLKKTGNDVDEDDLDGNKLAPSRAFDRPGGVMQGVKNVIEDENSPWGPMILDAINALGFNEGRGMMDMWDEVKDLTESKNLRIIDGKLRLL